MQCTFQVKDLSDLTWDEDRDDMPLLHAGVVVVHDEQEFRVAEGPQFSAVWETSKITASILVEKV